MRASAFATILLTLLPLLPATTTAAFAADSEASEQTKEATALFEEGNRLMRQRDYEHARLKFLAASALNKSAHNLWNLAICELESNRFVEAAVHFRKFIRRPDVDSTRIPDANASLARALARVGQVQITVPGATAKVDGGDEYGVTALVDPIPVSPGRHHVEVYGPTRMSIDVEVVAGQTVTVSPPEPPPEPARTVATTPLPDATGPSAATPQPNLAARGNEEPAQGGLTTGRKVAIGLGVAAVAVAGVGVGFRIAANDAGGDAASLRGSNADSSCTPSSSSRCSSLHNDVTTAKNDPSVATGLFIGGGALAAGALAVWLLTPPHPVRAGWFVSPALDRTGAGLRLSGDF